MHLPSSGSSQTSYPSTSATIKLETKALQLSQNASMQDVPPEIRDNLKKEVK